MQNKFSQGCVCVCVCACIDECIYVKSGAPAVVIYTISRSLSLALSLSRALSLSLAEEKAGTFSAQNISNTLWAYAVLKKKPGGRLMGLLERRAEVVSPEFKSQVCT